MMSEYKLADQDEQMTVSIIVPVFNVKNYLERCLNSIKEQTYKNIEVIVIDDGSNDGSDVICDRYAAEDARFHIYHQNNTGLSDARNSGLRHAAGKYVAFVDSDDWINKDMIEKLVKTAELQQYEIVCFDYFVSYTDYERYAPRYKLDSIQNLQKEKALSLLISNKIESYICMKFYKRTLFDEIRFPIGKKYEDIGTTYKLFMKADRIGYYPEAFYHYWQRDDSITHLSKKTNLQYLCDTQDIFEFKKDMELAVGREYPQLINELQAASEDWAIKLYNSAVLFEDCDISFRKELKKESYNYLRSNYKGLMANPYTSKKHKYRLTALVWVPGIYNSFILPYFYKKRGNVS
ncbi:MAG: glycosyltransferase family 2 protein [Erysipelotrichaceae bacterium]|nr:glycosyltransferase family 2 protein [Erysipelotrichaceae bacterium]